MYRAQGILKVLREHEVENRKRGYKTEGIMARINWLYKEYQRVSWYCGQSPLPLGKWLLEKI